MLLKLDAIGAGRLFSKNLSSEDADVVAENVAVAVKATITNNTSSQKLYYAKTVANPNRNLTPEKARARIETCRARIRKNEARIAELEEYLRNQEKM
jgi:hypothetical protein